MDHIDITQMTFACTSSLYLDPTQVGSETQETSYKNNAGGNVTFDEMLSFLDKPLLTNRLIVKVLDKGTVSDSLMGSSVVNLNKLDLQEEEERDLVVDVEHKGKPAGKVVLSLTRRAVPSGAWAGPFQVTIVAIKDFSDILGSFGRLDPLVLCQVRYDWTCRTKQILTNTMC